MGSRAVQPLSPLFQEPPESDANGEERGIGRELQVFKGARACCVLFNAQDGERQLAAYWARESLRHLRVQAVVLLRARCCARAWVLVDTSSSNCQTPNSFLPTTPLHRSRPTVGQDVHRKGFALVAGGQPVLHLVSKGSVQVVARVSRALAITNINSRLSTAWDPFYP